MVISDSWAPWTIYSNMLINHKIFILDLQKYFIQGDSITSRLIIFHFQYT